MCLPSDAFLQHLPSYLGFSYLGHGISLHGCSSKAQLDEGYLLTTALPDLQRGIAPLGPPVPVRPMFLGLLLPAAAPGLRRGVAPPGCSPWPPAQGGSSWVPPLALGTGWLLRAITPGLGHGAAPLSRSCAVTAWHSRLLPLTSDVG